MSIRVSSISRLAFPLLAGLLLPFAASASNFSYTWIEGSYGNITIDDSDGDLDGDAWKFGAAWQVHEMVFLFGSYESGDFDYDLETDTFELGVGMAFPMGDRADLVVGASYVDVSAEVPTFGISADDDGYSLLGGLRFALAEALQGEVGVRYVDLTDSGDDTSFYIGGRYYFAPTWALGAGYSTGDDVDQWTISIRWEMPR